MNSVLKYPNHISAKTWDFLGVKIFSKTDSLLYLPLIWKSGLITPGFWMADFGFLSGTLPWADETDSEAYIIIS